MSKARFLQPVTRKLLRKAAAVLGVVALALPTHHLFGQTTETDEHLNNLVSIASQFSAGRPIFTRTDQALWQAAIQGDELDKYDKRLTNLLLPKLAAEFGDIRVQSLFGYTEEGNNISREFSGANNVSQRSTGKAAAITAIGTASCGTETLFARFIDPRKPLWLHHQKDKEIDPTLKDFFGRSFDRAVREVFWLQGRAFTNTLSAPKSWSDFLQRVAKGSIEEQFALPAGSLGTAPVSEMEATLGRLRLAAQLDLPDLPLTDNEDDLYTDLGQWAIEDSLALPRYSLTGDSWRSVYQNIGFRVLEDQFAQSSADLRPSPFSEFDITTNPRFQRLAQQLEKRAKQYADPRRALNLPTEAYLPSTDDSLGLLDTLIIGDPDAFATVGAYYLADSLHLSPLDTETFIKSVADGEERMPGLASARPFDPSLPFTELFSFETSEDSRLKLFQEQGRLYEPVIKDSLKRLNEIVLLSISGSNKNPSYKQVIGAVTNETTRQALFMEIGKVSAKEADYPDGFTAKELQTQASEIMAEAFNLFQQDIIALADPERNESDPELKVAASTIDTMMGWPEGTTMTIARQELNENSAAAELYEQQRLRQGATKLWATLGLNDSLSTVMNNLFFSGILPTDDEVVGALEGESETISTPSPGKTTPTSDGDDSPDDEDEEEDEEDEDLGFDDDEIVQFAVAPEELGLASGLYASTQAPLSSIDALLAGRMRPALTEFTLASLAREFSDGSTITPGKLIQLYQQPSKDMVDAIAGQAESISSAYIVDQNFFSGLSSPQNDNFYPTWKTLTNEIIRQWNIGCPNLKNQTDRAISDLIATAAKLPGLDEVEDRAREITRPVQMITFNRDMFDDETKKALSAAYPGMGDKGVKWGLYTAPRAWDHLYIGY